MRLLFAVLTVFLFGCAATPVLTQKNYWPKMGGVVTYDNWSTGQEKTRMLASDLMKEFCSGNFLILGEGTQEALDGVYHLGNGLSMPLEGEKKNIRFECSDIRPKKFLCE